MSNEINLRAVDLREDPIEDKCAPIFENNCTAAVLEINGIGIPLCLTRLQSLIDAINKFAATIFCYKCDHFIMSRSGWNYGGSCKYQAQQHNDTVTELTAGYKYCVDCMHTCPHAIEKSNKNLSEE